MKTAVIGSGVAGLAVACRLASRGVKVDLFEKNSTPTLEGFIDTLAIPNPETKKLYDKDDMDRLFVQINQVTQIYYHFTGVQIVWENLREDNQAELARIANRHLESLDLIFDALNMLMTRVNQFLNLGNSSGLGTGITADEE